MKCPKCGTEYEGNFCPNGCNSQTFQQKAKKPLFKKWWFWLIIVLIAVIALSSGGSEDATPTLPNNVTPSINAASPGDTTQSTTTAPKPNNIYVPGDVINANGLKITYVSAEKYVTDNMFTQPEEGYIHIRLKLHVENTSDSDKYISSFEFECYADGTKAESYILGDDTLTGGTISSGRKTEGYIYFTIPVNAKEIEVEYETSFWTDKKAILIVTLGES